MHPAQRQTKLRRHLACIAPLLLLPATLAAQQATITPTAPLPATLKPSPPELIVAGFAGGFIKRTSSVHGEIALALHLRNQYGATIHSEIFENHHGDQAHREILRLIAAEHIPNKSARVILYGHSWGASEAVAVARQLQLDGVPVLLVAQVDGVNKREADDSIIPANVGEAINFYQTEGLLHGRPVIHAADPTATKILGNIQLSYKGNDIPTPGYPWIARTFTRRHIEIENDPRVWSRIETMILSHITPQTESQKDVAAAPLPPNPSL
jgi:pimeloyl-ACP methyl ester carboxylesterase